MSRSMNSTWVHLGLRGSILQQQVVLPVAYRPAILLKIYIYEMSFHVLAYNLRRDEHLWYRRTD